MQIYCGKRKGDGARPSPLRINLVELGAALGAELCAVGQLCAAVGAEGGLGGGFGGLFAAAVGTEGHVSAVGRAAGARPAALGGLGSGLLAAAAGAEGHIVAVGRAAGALPAALLGLLLRLLLLLILHLLLIGGGERACHVARGIHAKANAHERCARARGVAAGGFHAARHCALNVAFAHAGIGQHCALIAHVDELLALFVIGQGADTHGLHLHAAVLVPFFVQHVRHVLGKLARLAGYEAYARAVGAHLVDGGLKGLEELVKILLVYVVYVHALRVAGNGLGIELERFGDLYGIGAVRAQEEFRIIEAVEIVDGRAGAELYALYFLKIDEEYLLAGGRCSAVLYTAEGLLERIAELAAEKARHGGIVHLEVAGLRGVVHHLAAVYQHHELIIVNMDYGAVGHGVRSALGVLVAAVALAHLYAAGENGVVSHGSGLDNLKPAIRQSAAYCAGQGLDYAHNIVLLILFSVCFIIPAWHPFVKQMAGNATEICQFASLSAVPYGCQDSSGFCPAASGAPVPMETSGGLPLYLSV